MSCCWCFYAVIGVHHVPNVYHVTTSVIYVASVHHDVDDVHCVIVGVHHVHGVCHIVISVHPIASAHCVHVGVHCVVSVHCLCQLFQMSPLLSSCCC